MKIILILLFIFFHTFSSGQWIFVWSVPRVISIAINSEEECVRYDGEVKECNQYDKDWIYNLKDNYGK